MKIYEYQECVSDPRNCQARTVEYESWEQYIKDVKTFDKLSSIPRQTLISNLKISENSLSFEFIHRVINQTIRHTAIRIPDEHSGVIK